MSENLRDEIAERLLSKAERSYGWSAWAAADEIADLVGPELDRLRAEVDRLRGSTDRAHQSARRAGLRADRAEAERDVLRARLAKVEQALAGHPECDVYPDDDPITCGWKSAVADVTAALASVPEPSGSEPQPERWFDRLTGEVIEVEPSDSEPAPDGVALIAAERQRQIDQEGYTPEHDRDHEARLLAQAACAYALSANRWLDDARNAWPWDQGSFKPHSFSRDLVRAGALIAATLDRLGGE